MKSVDTRDLKSLAIIAYQFESGHWHHLSKGVEMDYDKDPIIRKKQEECIHDFKVVDGSFSHEFGTETIVYERCTICDVTKDHDPYEPWED